MNAYHACKNTLRLTLPVLLALLLLSACSATKEQVDEAQNAGFEAAVQVTNRNWLSMEIYVVGQSRRVRLGRIGAGNSKRFVIPGTLISGATALRFEMEPSNGSANTVSEEFVVAPGEEILLIIPNTR